MHWHSASKGRISPGHDTAILEPCCKGACVGGDVLQTELKRIYSRLHYTGHRLPKAPA